MIRRAVSYLRWPVGLVGIGVAVPVATLLLQVGLAVGLEAADWVSQRIEKVLT